MKTVTKVLIVSGFVLAFFGIVIGLMHMNYNNNEKSLRSQTVAQLKVCKISFDNMWKILHTEAKVPDQYKEAMKEIYIPLMEGRYGDEKGGTLMKWVQEHNPTFDSKVYTNLMASIEAERKSFFHQQERLIDLDREHHNALVLAPSSWFVSDTSEVKFTIITSTKTEKVYETGKEDDIELFDKK